MSKVTQAIVLSVFELTMPPSDDSDIFECAKSTKTTTDKFKITQNNFTESAEKPFSENYQEDSEKAVMQIKITSQIMVVFKSTLKIYMLMI